LCRHRHPSLGGFALLRGDKFIAGGDYPANALFFDFVPVKLFLRHHRFGVHAFRGCLLTQQGIHLLIDGCCGLGGRGNNNNALRLSCKRREEEKEEGQAKFHSSKGPVKEKVRGWG